MPTLHSLTLVALILATGWSGVWAVRAHTHRLRALSAGIAALQAVLVLLLIAGTDPAASDGGSVAWFLAPGVLSLGMTGLLHMAAVRLPAAPVLGLDRGYLDELMEGASDPAALLDREGKILRANRALGDLLSRPPDALTGSPLARLVVEPAGDPDPLDELLQSLVRGRVVAVRARLRRSNREPIAVSIDGTPVRIPGERVASLILVRDISARVRAEITLRHLETAVETMQLGVTVTDLDGRIIYMNPADAALHGYEVEELLGRDVGVLAPPPLREPLSRDEVEELTRWSRESVNVRKDGEQFPVQLMSDVVRDADGEAIGIVTTCQDITARKRAERRLQESEERYALAARGTGEGVWDWDLETGSAFFSERWATMLGLDEDELEPTIDAWFERVHPDDRERLRAEVRAHRLGRTPRIECEHRMLHKDGGYRWVVARGVAKRGSEGRVRRIAGSLSDVTERKLAEKKLAKDALFDPLTGLPNRAFLHDLLNRAHGRTKQKGEGRFAVLFADLDRFKEINDTLGHAAGDEMLVEVARRLQKSVRPGDVVARISGDEFCILLTEVGSSTDSTRVAERIHEALEESIVLGDRRVSTSVSIGIAVAEAGEPDPDTLLKNADAAMYRAKSRGRGGFEVFDRHMHQRAMELRSMEEDLRHALENEQFHLLYQPVVDLETHRVTSLEALVRWVHPERGEVTPDAFLPVAEETGVIVPLGWWTLNEASRRMAEWSERFSAYPDLSVAVNLTRRQLRQPDLVGRVDETIVRAGLEPRRLKLEVKEGDLMQDPEANARVIRDLRDLGVQVEVDDFGTGSSFLTNLDRFQISGLKLDPTFAAATDGALEREPMVQAVVELARTLGIRVVAEGVETSHQGDRLRDLRCEEGQGYLFHHPLDLASVEELLSSPRANGGPPGE